MLVWNSIQECVDCIMTYGLCAVLCTMGSIIEYRHMHSTHACIELHACVELHGYIYV